MRKVVAAALVSLVALASPAARAETGVIDTGSDAFVLDVALDASLDVALEVALDADDASDTAGDDTFMADTFVEDTMTVDTFVAVDTAPPEDTAPEATPDAKPDAKVPTVLDSAGPIIDQISDGGWDVRGRTAERVEACGCEVVGRSSTNTFALALPLLVVVLRRRRR